MNSGVLIILSVVIAYVAAQNIVPAGFIPLPPLPVQTAIGQPASTPKVTPKPTLAPITKKQTTTKPPFKPVTKKPTLPPITKKQTTTKPPFKPVTKKPTLPPSSHLPPSRSVPAVTTKPRCGLNINVPNANCQGGNSAVQQTLNTLKQELDKTRQQHQAQNVAVQSMITKLQTQQSGYLNKIADLQNEVQNLVKAFNSLSGSRPISTAAPVTQGPVGTGVSNTFLQQAVQNVRNDMNQAVGDFNTKVFNLSSLMLTNQQQELKVQQSIESQIQQQASEIGRLSQQVIDLNRLLQQLKTEAKLQAEISKVAADIQLYDQTQQNQFSSLNLKTSSLLAEVNNHTSQMRGLQTNLLLAQSRVNAVDKDITVVHDGLAQFRKATLPRLNQLESDVKALTTNVSSVQRSVGNVGNTVFKLVGQIGQDTATLTSLKTQNTQLQKDVTKIQGDLNTQASEISSIKSGVTSLKNAVPISELNKMNNSILQILNALNKGNSPNKTQLQDLTKAITTITNKLGALSVTGTPSG